MSPETFKYLLHQAAVEAHCPLDVSNKTAKVIALNAYHMQT